MQNPVLIDQTRCFHCGEECAGIEIHIEDKSFCCEGCKTVFQILHENDLCTYYDLDENAGKTIKTGIERKRFEYLKDLDVEHKLVDFKQGELASITFYIPNIHCTSCVWLLENLQNIDNGIQKGIVNFLKRTVTILYNTNGTSLRSIVELLTTIGYEPDLKLEQLQDKTTSKADRSVWLKLGVAGFCFGNIMLFSFPEYLNLDQSGSSEGFRYFFGALNIILALPVLLFSSVDYLKSAWAALSQKGINLDVPISIGIIALFGRSLYEILSGTGAGYFDSFTGFIFFLLIGKVVQKKTFDRLSFNRDYKSYLPISVIRVIEGLEQSISVDKLEIGDHIITRNHELVPADAVLESNKAQIDYSFITGESEPITVTKGQQVYAGGKIIGNHAKLIISKKVEQSYLTQLWENESFKPSDKDKTLTSLADRISPYFTFTVLGIAFASLFIWLQIEPSKAFTIFTAVLIVACPCALALSTPFTLGSAVNILSLNGLYVRSTSVLEELSKADTFVFDKTGTITESEKSEIRFIGESLSQRETDLISSTSRQSIHPLSKKIFRELSDANPLSPNSFHEVEGKGIFAAYGDDFIWIGSKAFLLEHTSLSEMDFTFDIHKGSKVHVAINSSYKGFFLLQNSVRSGLEELLRELSKTGDIFLLSGDNKQEAKKLANIFPGWSGMLFNQSPTQKLDFIKSLRNQERHIIMIGDGLNDAGALQTSHFGIAISDDMSSFSPACDAIAEANSLKQLDRLLDFSKSAFRIILFSFALSLFYNLTGLGFAITGHLSPLVAAILMPLSSISIMAFAYSTTRIVAKKMGLKIWV